VNRPTAQRVITELTRSSYNCSDFFQKHVQSPENCSTQPLEARQIVSTDESRFIKEDRVSDVHLKPDPSSDRKHDRLHVNSSDRGMTTPAPLS
jgi:hypothetical protein